MMEEGKKKAEGRGQRAEVRRHEERRKTEERAQMAEGRGNEEGKGQSSPRVTASPPPRVPPSPLLDLRGTPCPINFVRTKLKLEQMPSGEVLEVWLDPGEPIEQVPDSLTMEGYKIESIEERAEFFSLKVCRPVVS